MNSHVTIYQVAALAGVSIKSVSRVINGEPNVTPKMRAKVEEALRQLDYKPHVAARALGGARAFAVAIIFDSPSPAYMMRMLDGAYRACNRLGYQLVLEKIDTSSDTSNQLNRILQRRLDGVVLAVRVSDSIEVLEILKARGVPYVRSSPSFDLEQSPYVDMDDEAASAEVARHLWSLGHRHFGLVNGPKETHIPARRRAGFLNALASFDDTKVLEADGEFSFSSGIQAGLDLLQRKTRPTAIYATNDDMAAGVFAAANQLGLAIPTDVSVVGFDDSWIGERIWPALTTVYQPFTEMADAAVELLVSNTPQAEQRLPYHLVIRESTSAPTKGAQKV